MKRIIPILTIFFLSYSAFSQDPAEKAKVETQLIELYTHLIDSTFSTLVEHDEWNSSRSYWLGALIQYKGVNYESLQSDNTETPDAKSKLWKRNNAKEIIIKGINLNSALASWDFHTKMKQKFSHAFDSAGRLKAGAPQITFRDCKFPAFYLNDFNIEKSVSFDNCEIGNLSIDNLKAMELNIDNNYIEDIGIMNSQIEGLYISDLKEPKSMWDQKQTLYFFNSAINNAHIVYLPKNIIVRIQECKFPGDTATVQDDPFWVKDSNAFYFDGTGNNTHSDFTIVKSSFGTQRDSSTVVFKGSFGTLEIDSSIFFSQIGFNLNVQEKFHLTDNNFKGLVALNNATLPIDVKIRWSQFTARNLSKFKSSITYDPMTGTYRPVEYFKTSHEDGVKNLDHYEDIMRSYQTLYTFYKNAGDIESANSCFSEMKDVQTERYAYLFSHEKTFKSFFRWKLAQLMKFYTSHGTDPARAIVISMWVMLAFAVFYFFFPSDWDVTSKSKLFSNYKDFIEKNEKGYIKPFFVLALGFSVSLLNAFTLSVNSFTTLGFGNIPTHGIAKYFCVLEGFIGWFLLSIFTVALINQVLG